MRLQERSRACDGHGLCSVAVHVSVINGVNLGMLGKREPAVYGATTLSELESRIYGWARELGFTARCMQFDHEGDYVEAVHDSLGWAGGVIVNPGAWTHYSYAIRDALAMLDVPIVEVHISDVENREPWRRVSVIADIVAERIVGHGIDGYRLALEAIGRRTA
jgi:3-dehydroquinate dehydratase-2